MHPGDAGLFFLSVGNFFQLMQPVGCSWSTSAEFPVFSPEGWSPENCDIIASSGLIALLVKPEGSFLFCSPVAHSINNCLRHLYS